MKNFGIRGEELVTEVGANAKMNEFAAIMGLCNLGRVDITLRERKERYDLYVNELEKVKGVMFFARNKEADNNYAYFPILIENDYRMSRDELYAYLRENNIFSRKYFYPLTSDQACFKNKYKKEKMDCARELARKVLVIPLYETLRREDQETIVKLIAGN